MSVQIKLEYPFKVDGTLLEGLTMRRPRVSDMRKAHKNGATDAEKEISLFAHLCEVPPASFDDMDWKDYGKLQEAYKGFIDSGETK